MTGLARLVEEIAAIGGTPLLLTGDDGGKTRALRELAIELGVPVVNLGARLGRMLAATPKDKRGFSVGEYIREIAGPGSKPVLLDNIEVLFERGLSVNPLDALKRLAHARPVVAVWPGTLRGGRLAYADPNHPEHREWAADGVVTRETRKQ